MLVFLVALTSLPRIEKDVNCAIEGMCYPTEPELDTTTETIVWTNYTSYGTCACDVSSSCDPNCCCDPDCPAGTVFSYCLPETNPDEDNIKYQWAQRMCSEPEDPERRGTLIDWFMRTMLCIYKDNNPVLGDFYHTVAAFGTLSSTDVGVDDAMSFRNAFSLAAATATSLTPGTPITPSTQMLRRDPTTGNCVASTTTVNYLEEIDEECTLDATCSQMTTAMGSNGVTVTGCAAAYTSWNVSINVTGTAPNWGTTTATFDSTTAGATSGSIVRVSIKWTSNAAADPALISKRGYSFGEAVQTPSGTFKVYVPDTAGGCSTASLRDVKFGDNLEVPCLVEKMINTSAGITIDPILFTDLEGLNGQVLAAPNQPGLVNEQLTVSTVTGYEMPTSSDEPMLDGVIQLYTFWYKLVGAKANPQNVIDQVQVQYIPIPGAYNISEVLSNQYLNMSKMWTRVRFFEVPNNVNMKIASDVNINAQSWLPF